MTDLIKQKIIDDFQTLMETITTVNLYETNRGSDIEQWRTGDWHVAEDALAGNIEEGEEDIVASGVKHTFTLPLSLDIKVSGSASVATLRKAVADVTKSLGGETKFSTYIDTIRPTSNGQPEFEKKDLLYGSITMNFEVIYNTGDFDPYNSA